MSWLDSILESVEEEITDVMDKAIDNPDDEADISDVNLAGEELTDNDVSNDPNENVYDKVDLYDQTEEIGDEDVDGKVDTDIDSTGDDATIEDVEESMNLYEQAIAEIMNEQADAIEARYQELTEAAEDMANVTKVITYNNENYLLTIDCMRLNESELAELGLLDEVVRSSTYSKAVERADAAEKRADAAEDALAAAQNTVGGKVDKLLAGAKDTAHKVTTKGRGLLTDKKTGEISKTKAAGAIAAATAAAVGAGIAAKKLSDAKKKKRAEAMKKAAEEMKKNKNKK